MRKASRMLVALVASLAIAAVLAPAAIADNGQKIGQDDLRLALTQCSNAGAGNGGEFEVAVLGRSVDSDCLNKKLLRRYSSTEVDAILAQANCIGPFLGSFVCEVDPGNSAAHNQAGL